MTVKEMLKKDTYFELVNAMRFNPDSLDDDTLYKIKIIQDMFQDKYILEYQNNAVRILKMYLEGHTTIEDIAEKMNISSRHVDRLKKQAIESISKVLDRPSP